MTKLLHHKKPAIQIQSLGIIHRILKDYYDADKNLNDFDKRLLKAFCIRIEGGETDENEKDRN